MGSDVGRLGITGLELNVCIGELLRYFRICSERQHSALLCHSSQRGKFLLWAESSLSLRVRNSIGRFCKAAVRFDCIDDSSINGNNTAERAMKPVAIGRKNWMFAGSQHGGNSMAIAFTSIETAKLNTVDPQAWLCAGARGSVRAKEIQTRSSTVHPSSALANFVCHL